MPLQRRYSVTGQTPPDDVGAMKPHASPKLQALDTSVQATSCGLCEPGPCSVPDAGDAPAATSTTTATAAMDPGEADRGRKSMAHHITGRTSSKRSATQLPSPNTPSSHELPTKIARLGLDHDAMDDDDGCLTDPFPEESDWALSSCEDSFSTSAPSSPSTPPSSEPDDPLTPPLDSPPCTSTTTAAAINSTAEPEAEAEDLALSPLSPSPPSHAPATLLTLPPELRHQIYRHLPDLVLPHPLIYCLSTFANNMQHPLASVSRLVRAEALAIFYSYNTWVIKLEFRLMYEAFRDWIIRLGDGAALLRVVTIAVRGRLFKPNTRHANAAAAMAAMGMGPLAGNAGVGTPGMPPAAQMGAAPVEEYHPPDGDASFRIDLSEKWPGGRVELVRCDGSREAGESARVWLKERVEGLWERRRAGVLNGQDWVDLVDGFLGFTGWW